MQSFQKYDVSEFLKDRHPYLDPPFTSAIDPSQVTLAVFFRKVPKLADCLDFENLPFHLRTDALHTLNEMVYHQETKDEMIRLSILRSCGTLLSSDSADVRKEAALLIGGMVTLMQGRNLLIDSDVFPPLQAKLTDVESKVRSAVAWTLKRILLSRDGVHRIVSANTVPTMVSAFIKFAKSPKIENQVCLKELLEGFANVSCYDNGITPMLGTGLMPCLIEFLTSAESLEEASVLQELTLNVISNIALNHTGKKEACEGKAIQAAGRFLEKRASDEQKKLAASVVMSVSIDLEGKFQAVRIESKGKPVILKRLYKLLIDEMSEIRENSKQSFLNISELPEGFDKSVVILSQNISILDEVYGINCIKPLARLLPKLSSYSNPPDLDQLNLELHKRCIQSLEYLLEKYPKGVDEAIDTVNISQKLGPFLAESSGVSEQTAKVLKMICGKCQHNKEVLKNFISDVATEGIKRNLVKYPNLTI